jgi:tight adherence protein B
MRSVVIACLGVTTTAWLVRRARRERIGIRLRPRPRGRSLVPDASRDRVRNALASAAVDLDVDQAVQSWLIAVTVAALLGYGFGGWALALAGFVIAAAAGPVSLFALRHRRERQIAAGVPDALERIASELRAGGTIGTAVGALSSSDSPLAGDLARVDTRLRMGASTTDALDRWARERSVAGVSAAAGALAVCATLGGRSADALDGLASSLRDRQALVAETRALSAQARMSAVVVGGAPLAYLAWSSLVDRDALHALVATEIGRVCLLVGIGLELLGALWMRRIMQTSAVL